MKYFVYNKTKDKRIPGDFEYRDALFSRSSLGRILRMLLEERWAGDEIAILPENTEGHDAEAEDLVFLTDSADIKPVVVSGNEYVVYDWGCFYQITQDRKIDRFDTLIPLIALNPPVFEPYYQDMNGKWAFKPLKATDVFPEDKEDLSAKYDVESFYQVYPDEDILDAFEGEDIPEDGFWVCDLMGQMDEKTADEEEN